MSARSRRYAPPPGVKTAHSDAEYVRLSACRSWWDELSGPIEHGPLPADSDPWIALPAPEGAPEGSRDAAA